MCADFINSDTKTNVIVKRNSDNEKGKGIKAMNRQESVSHLRSRMCKVVYACLSGEKAKDNDPIGIFKSIDAMIDGRFKYTKSILDDLCYKDTSSMDKAYENYVEIREKLEEKFPDMKVHLDNHIMEYCDIIFRKNKSDVDFGSIFKEDFNESNLQSFDSNIKNILNVLNEFKYDTDRRLFIKKADKKKWKAELILEELDIPLNVSFNQYLFHSAANLMKLIYDVKKDGFNLDEEFFDTAINSPELLNDNPMWMIIDTFLQNITTPYGLTTIAKDSEHIPTFIKKLAKSFGSFVSKYTVNTSLSRHMISKTFSECMEIRLLNITKKTLSNTRDFHDIFVGVDGTCSAELLSLAQEYLSKSSKCIWETNYTMQYFVTSKIDICKIIDHSIVVMNLPRKEDKITEKHVADYKITFLNLVKHLYGVFSELQDSLSFENGTINVIEYFMLQYGVEN